MKGQFKSFVCDTHIGFKADSQPFIGTDEGTWIKSLAHCSIFTVLLHYSNEIVTNLNTHKENPYSPNGLKKKKIKDK